MSMTRLLHRSMKPVFPVSRPGIVDALFRDGRASGGRTVPRPYTSSAQGELADERRRPPWLDASSHAAHRSRDARGEWIVRELLRELDIARVDRGLSFASIGRVMGLSSQQVGRLFRGQALTLVRAAQLC